MWFRLLQSLIPDKMREANQKIEGDMTRFQHNLAQLRQQKEEIGTDRDSDDLRQRVIQKMKDMDNQQKKLQELIDDYSNISVPYRS